MTEKNMTSDKLSLDEKRDLLEFLLFEEGHINEKPTDAVRKSMIDFAKHISRLVEMEKAFKNQVCLKTRSQSQYG